MELSNFKSALKYNTVIPAIFTLMPNKTQSFYNRLFAALKMLKPNLNPNFLMSDFEIGAINSFKEAFPDAIERGCFSIFHNVYGENFSNAMECSKRGDYYRTWAREVDIFLPLKNFKVFFIFF